VSRVITAADSPAEEPRNWIELGKLLDLSESRYASRAVFP
jgi:hypothetical protein